MLHNKHNIKFNPRCWDRPSSEGFTLIEVLISIVVFTIGIFAALGLSVSNYNDSQNNLDRIIATNLAREGIELVKNVRDSNWLKIEASDTANCGGNPCTWDYGLINASDYATISYSSTTLNFLGSCAALNISNCLDLNPDTRLEINAINYYTHGTGVKKTKYSRVIKLAKICLKSDAQVDMIISMGGDPANYEHITTHIADSCDADETPVGFQVISRVQWQDNGTKYIEMVDFIYNWRR